LAYLLQFNNTLSVGGSQVLDVLAVKELLQDVLDDASQKAGIFEQYCLKI